jgi:polyferredoxin
MPRQDPPPLPKDGIYRAILLALVVTILGGAVVALSGDYYFHDEDVKNTGVGIVLVGGFIYFFFRVLGRREARKRELGARDARNSDDGEEPPPPR